MSNILLIIPPERFRDEELFETKAVLEKAGHRCRIASTKTGVCPGSRGGSARAELDLARVKVGVFDAVIFVGGGGSKLLFNNETALTVARDAYRECKVVAAICLAPVVLANAGVLKGLRATVAGTEANTISAKGATYTGPGVTADGRVVTANGPKSSTKFAEQICELLATGSKARAATQK